MLEGLGNIAFLFVLIFYGIMLFACIGIGWIGFKLLENLGRFPSKTPAIQMSVLFKLVLIEIVSLTMLVLFFKVLVAS